MATSPSNADLLAVPPSPTPTASTSSTVDERFDSLIIVIAYIVSLLVILTVLHRLYSHTYHFTPPYRQAYEELVAARGLVQRGAIEFADHHDNRQHFGPVAATMASDPRGEGTSGSGGGRSGLMTHEIVAMEEDTQFSSEVLARLEQDLRATSFRERERLAAALNADLPSGRSFLFPIQSNSSRTTLPPDFDDWSLDSLNRATQSARFTHVIVSPLSSTSTASSAAALGNNNNNNSSHRLVPPRRSRSELSFQALTMPSTAFDANFHRDFHRAIQSARFSAGNTQSSLSIPSTSAAQFGPGVVIRSAPSTTDAAGLSAGSSGWTSTLASVRLYNPRNNLGRR
ncbi:unnamed protein product [Calypogeia fissa]